VKRENSHDRSRSKDRGKSRYRSRSRSRSRDNSDHGKDRNSDKGKEGSKNKKGYDGRYLDNIKREDDPDSNGGSGSGTSGYYKGNSKPDQGRDRSAGTHNSKYSKTNSGNRGQGGRYNKSSQHDNQVYDDVSDIAVSILSDHKLQMSRPVSTDELVIEASRRLTSYARTEADTEYQDDTEIIDSHIVTKLVYKDVDKYNQDPDRVVIDNVGD
jgi:hypothetical protein